MQSELKVLLIDDNRERVRDLKVILDFVGEDCAVSSSNKWREEQKDFTELLAVVIGEHLSYSNLSDLILEIQQLAPNLPVVLVGDVSFSGTVSDDLQCQIVGRLDIPLKYNQVLEIMHACQECHHNQHVFSGGPQPIELFRSLVGASAAVHQVRNLISQVADSDANVLVLGDSGTGKEVAARNIHYLSERSSQPFVPVNCGAIPAELLESELFGHEKGAFTGALSARQGRFELAQGGTLFLDEIGDMPLPMQVKILRVLQEKCFERVGSNKTIHADVRIIAATHRELEEEIKKGVFREDLYYRLNVFPIEMPSLRDRSEDIPLLVNELIARLEQRGRNSVRFSDNAMTSLMRHSWPGNVRELANLVERMCILYPYGVVDINDLPAKYQHSEGLVAFTKPKLTEQVKPKEQNEQAAVDDTPSDKSIDIPATGLDLKAYIAELEVDYIVRALNNSDWVVAKAASLLGMRRTTLVEKMKKYSVVRDKGKQQNIN